MGLTRREVLGLGVFGALGLVGGGVCWGKGRSAVVIGAGASGLGAAQGLVAQGWEVVVLEARERVGGRVWTNRALGTPIDLGASWIEGTRGNPLTELAQREGASLVATDWDAVRLRVEGEGWIDEDELEALGERGEALLEALYEGGEEAEGGLNVAEGLRRTRGGARPKGGRERQLHDWLVGSEIVVETGAELEELAWRWLGADEAFGGPSKVFPRGYDAIFRGVARGLDVRTGEVVQGVEWGEGGVVVTTQGGGRFAADVAVVTLPLGVLKAGAVEFSPPLPASKRAALGRLEMGVLNKVAVRFPRAFWPREPHFFGWAAKRRGEFPEFMNWARYTDEPVLIAFTGGAFARALEALSEGEVEAAVMRPLRAMFGRAVPDPERLVRTAWGADPFARGSYSHVPPGASFKDYDALASPVGDRLFFAGEATNRSYPATVHGAWLSGRREAARIAGR